MGHEEVEVRMVHLLLPEPVVSRTEEGVCLRAFLNPNRVPDRDLELVRSEPKGCDGQLRGCFIYMNFPHTCAVQRQPVNTLICAAQIYELM